MKPLCILIYPDGRTKMLGVGSAREAIFNQAKRFCAIIWMREPTTEQREAAKNSMKSFADAKEMTIIQYLPPPK